MENQLDQLDGDGTHRGVSSALVELRNEIGGDHAVLLVDTYDSRRGIERAIRVAGECRRNGTEIRAIRLDSGDLAALARYARQRLDEAGFDGVGVFVSGGLDEHEISRLIHEEASPIDGFGVGSALGVSDDAPTLETVYKLVSYEGRPVRMAPASRSLWRDASVFLRSPVPCPCAFPPDCLLSRLRKRAHDNRVAAG